MARVQIRDTSLWTKHIDGDPELRRRLEALPPGEKIWLRVDGKRGRFEKMRAGPHGPMQGLKPVDETRELWREIYPKKAGQRVDLKVEDDLPPPPSAPASPPAALPAAAEWAAASDAEREAAWNAFKALTKAGWRSEGAGGGRDELHER